MKNYEIVTIGTAVRDVVFYTDEGEVVKNPKKDPTKLDLLGFELGAKLRSEKVHFTFGGGAANTGVNFSGLGLKTGVIAAVGDDMEGRDIAANLESKGVDTSLLHKARKERSGLSFLAVDEKTNEHVVFVYYGANLSLKASKAELAGLDSAWFYISSIASNAWPDMMSAAAAAGRKIAWNPGSTQLSGGFKKLANYMPDVEVFLVNKDEATELVLSRDPGRKDLGAGSLAKEIFSWGPGMVAVSDGRRGVWVYDGRRVRFDKPSHGRPVDTTGAGDCFGSTFVAALIRTDYDIPRSMELAIANASSLVYRPGAQIGLLSWNKLMKKI